MGWFSDVRARMLRSMVHDRAVPGAATLIQRVSRQRTRENYRFAATMAAGKRVLDIGPGYGVGYDVLLAGNPRRIVCIDRFEDARERFQENDPRIEHVAGDFMENAFADASFDVVLCLATMYYLTDHDGLLREIIRVLVPGGVLVINTFDADLMQSIFGRVLTDLDSRYGPVYSGDAFRAKVGKAFGCEPEVRIQSPVTWLPRWRRVFSLPTLPLRLVLTRPRVVPGDGARRKGVYTMLAARKNAD